MNRVRQVALASLIIIAALITLLVWNRYQDAPETTGEPILFYCAAGIKPPVEAICNQYEKEYGKPIEINYAGSGTLLSNLRVAEKGDLYLAGDQSYIEIARKKGLVKEEIPVAHLVPIIAVKKGNPKKIQTVNDLLRDEVSFGLANPEMASVGRTSKDLLEQSGHWPKVARQADVNKPTVNEIANAIKIGSIDAGIIWDAVAAQYAELEIVHVPELDQGKQQITIAVLASSEQPTEALKFARYLTARDRGLQVFAEKGYNPVQGDKWAERPKIVLFSGTVNRPAIDKTLAEFQKREGCMIDVAYNGCGILVGQMKTGQRPDAYFACDVSFMHQVGDLFLDPINIAETDIVMLVENRNPKNIQSVHDLTNKELKVGICDPELSALGGLTKTLLDQIGIYEQVSAGADSTVNTGDMLINQFRAGALEAVIVYRVNTVHAADEEADIIEIDHPAAQAVQPIALRKDSDHHHLLSRLLKQIKSAESQETFKSVGFRWRGEGEDL